MHASDFVDHLETRLRVLHVEIGPQNSSKTRRYYLLGRKLHKCGARREREGVCAVRSSHPFVHEGMQQLQRNFLGNCVCMRDDGEEGGWSAIPHNTG